MLKKIIPGVVAAIIVFSIVVALQPAQFRVERSIVIAASPADVFPQVNDLRKAQVWSPWLKFDPTAKTTFEGPAEGTGASSTWAGNSQVGEGRQTITESRPNELVRIKLDFIKPLESTCTAEFTLKPEGSQTRVAWAMFGENGFVAKAFCLFMNQDKMIGGEFEKGLTDLKALVETAAKK